MSTQFTPPPTYASVVLYDENAQDVKALLRSVRFNPIWLKWFVDVAQFITSAGGGTGTITHNDLTGLQGGGATERYHLTASQASALTAGFTGTGNLVRATSPTLVTPALGTPASGILTNCTGLTTSGIVGGITATITTAKLTGAGANGSMTFTNGVLTASTPAT